MRAFGFCVLCIIISFTLLGCNGAKSKSDVRVSNSENALIQSSDPKKIANEVTDSNETNINPTSNTSDFTINIQANSFDLINSLFDMDKQQVLKLLGTDYEIVMAGAEGLEDGYEYTDYGITIVFESGEPYKIQSVECDEKVDIKGVKLGMTFFEIQEVLGKGAYPDDGEVIEVEDGEYIGCYYMNYHVGKRLIQFSAPDKNSKTKSLEIRRDYSLE